MLTLVVCHMQHWSLEVMWALVTLLEFQVLFFVFAATLLFSVALVVIARAVESESRSRSRKDFQPEESES